MGATREDLRGGGVSPAAVARGDRSRTRGVVPPALPALLAALAFALAGGAGAATIHVTTTEDELDATPNDACSLREAVYTVNHLVAQGVGGCQVIGTIGEDDEIVVPEGRYVLTRTSPGPFSVNDGAGNLQLFRNVAIRGAGPGRTVIDGSGALVLGANGLAPVHYGGVFELVEDGTAAIEGVTVTGGRARYGGGGIAVRGGATLSLTDVEVAGNRVEREGAGICSFGWLYLRNVTVSDNSGEAAAGGPPSRGGGVFSKWLIDARNVTISGNVASRGGGLHVESTIAGSVLDSVTITDNAALGDPGATGDTAGGVELRPVATDLRIVNTIVAGNAGPDHPDCSGRLDSLGHNLIGVANACSGFGPDDMLGAASSPLDPGLAPLDHYGGGTRTHALLPGSPAVDSGPPANGTGCPAADQRGFPRPEDGDGDGARRCDIGAY